MITKIIPSQKMNLYSPDSRVKIFDSRGIIFYDSKWSDSFNGYFTLPLIFLGGSVFKTRNKVFKTNNFQNYNFSYPNFEKNEGHDWSKFSIKFMNNPNKCTINHLEKKIIFDNSFKRKPYFILKFILLHEKGHNFYDTEKLADTFATLEMLKEGFTPHQILYGANNTLSNQSIERKQNILQTIIKSLA